MKPAIFLFITISSMLFSCKKDTPKAKGLVSDYVKFSEVAMSYVKLPDTGYYIYKDSSTGQEDSVIVGVCSLIKKYHQASSQVIYGGGVLNFPAAFYEEFTLELDKIDPTGNTSTWWNSFDTNLGHILSLNEKVDSSINLNFCFWYPFKTPYIYNYIHTDKISSISIEGKLYIDVVRFYVNNSSISGDPNDLIFSNYWAKGVGIIKMEIRKNQISKTDLLVRYGLR